MFAAGRRAAAAGGAVQLNAPDGIAAVVVTYQSNETIDSCLRRLRDADGVV